MAQRRTNPGRSPISNRARTWRFQDRVNQRAAWRTIRIRPTAISSQAAPCRLARLRRRWLPPHQWECRRLPHRTRISNRPILSASECQLLVRQCRVAYRTNTHRRIRLSSRRVPTAVKRNRRQRCRGSAEIATQPGLTAGFFLAPNANFAIPPNLTERNNLRLAARERSKVS